MSKQRNDRARSPIRMGSIALGYVGGIAPWLLAACSGDVINLGERENDLAVPAHSRCHSGTTLEGSAWVDNQEQVDALEGCEVIAGDLDIVAFGNANLRSLHALRSVEGRVRVGGHTPLERLHGAPVEDWMTEFVEYEASIINWLPSLEGLEHLETVDSVQLAAPVSSLEPLSGLRRINTGALGVSSDVLESLAGLEGVVGFDSLGLRGTLLRDISAVRLPETMESLVIQAPITTVYADELTSATRIDLADTELADLDAFSNLENVGELVLANNDLLHDTDGLNSVRNMDELSVRDNDALERLCDFTSLTALQSLQIQDNDNLTQIPRFPALYQSDLTPLTDRPIVNVEQIDLRGNARLSQLVIPGTWKVANVVIIDFTNLASIDFVNLQSVGTLIITANDQLRDVQLGALSSAAYLEVRSNYQLVPTAFDGVRSLDRHVD